MTNYLEDAAAEADLAAYNNRPTRVERLKEATDTEPVVIGHTCTSPNPDTCLHCALARSIAVQQQAREMEKTRAEKDAANNEDWWESA